MAGRETVFRDKITGTIADRPQFAKPMRAFAIGGANICTLPDRWLQIYPTRAIKMSNSFTVFWRSAGEISAEARP